MNKTTKRVIIGIFYLIIYGLVRYLAGFEYAVGWGICLILATQTLKEQQ